MTLQSNLDRRRRGLMVRKTVKLASCYEYALFDNSRFGERSLSENSNAAKMEQNEENT